MQRKVGLEFLVLEMNNTVFRLTLVVCFLFVLLHLGSCLRCYKCIEPHSQCEHSHPVKCNNQEVCGKSTSHAPHLPEITVKDCVSKNFCKNQQLSIHVSCYTCRRELCNSSTIVIPAFMMVAIFSINNCFL